MSSIQMRSCSGALSTHPCECESPPLVFLYVASAPQQIGEERLRARIAFLGQHRQIVHAALHILGRADAVELCERHSKPHAFILNVAPPSSAKQWHDMMSYQEGGGGCPRIPYWSNPKVKYKGEPTGTAASDNARVILEQAERVSKFR